MRASKAHNIAKDLMNFFHNTSVPSYRELRKNEKRNLKSTRDFVLSGGGLEEVHNHWYENEKAAGWCAGCVYCHKKKISPLCKPYVELAPLEKIYMRTFLSSLTSHH